MQIGFLISVVLGILTVVILVLFIWFVCGTHKRRNRGANRQLPGDHAVPAGDRCAQCPPAALFIAEGDDRSHRFDLTTSPVRVGRDPDNDLVIVEGVPHRDTVSRYHAWLYFDADRGRWIVEDPGSQNGTYVDGVRIDCHELLDGTHVAFGRVQALFGACPGQTCPGELVLSEAESVEDKSQRSR
jgi:hypothetical protein